jgi:hypothetical protein
LEILGRFYGYKCGMAGTLLSNPSAEIFQTELSREKSIKRKDVVTYFPVWGIFYLLLIN